MSNWHYMRAGAVCASLLATVLLSGCPPQNGGGGTAEYDAGFVAGFAEDGEYWQGYDDSWDTRNGGTIYYSGSEIPFIDDLSYDAGYWDGVWYAYNDGYFVAYDYAFTIGFSEGYDLAYYPDWYEFLLNDEHVEWLDGGFSDGYNDGFTEGSIVGASEYRDAIAYDWFEAMWWYRDGNDAYIAELDLSTGEIYLYEYGTDPADLIKSKDSVEKRLRSGHPSMSIRKMLSDKQRTEAPDLSYRPLIAEAQGELDMHPTTSPRADGTIALETTWLERVQMYRQSVESGKAFEKVERKSTGVTR